MVLIFDSLTKFSGFLEMDPYLSILIPLIELKGVLIEIIMPGVLSYITKFACLVKKDLSKDVKVRCTICH